ncbi:HD-GYP domain-containing protein [Catenovulum sediminis]|uniref:HD-GYP domain-containing protein n=1 Tax=Catenovulum sediminis TaxID=1740262 RepID=A0ABV1RE95_9ALTE|nr:HD-GYP domain-containing protein [Catenovulum sediminis]
MKSIPITELKPGMYVVSVSKQKGQLGVKSSGWVKNQAIIKSLKDKGVIEVEIDPDKTLESEDASRKQAKTPEQVDNSRKAKIKPVAVQTEFKKAKKLYSDAQDLQAKILKGISDGHAVDIGPVKTLTGQLIDSIFRNQDALACMTLIRDKDQYLLEHSLNVSILMAMFAKYLNISDDKIELYAQGAFLHDIGKILVPDEVLNKPGRLTPEEYEIIKKHVEFGVTTLENSPGIDEELIEIVSLHHEKLNGLGYPKGLTADEISLAGRMLSIVDIYDALTAERIYKKGMTPQAAFKILFKMAPNELDSELLNKFIQCVGIHPVGSLVQLDSGKLAIVIEANKTEPLKPIVKVFYNIKHKHYSEIKDLDLSKKHVNDSIERSIKPEQFDIELKKFFHEVLIP